MTQEVDEFLETPDSAKAEALSKEQLLEAWDKVTDINSDDAPTIHEDSKEILQDATDTYIIELANKSFDEMTPADLENIHNLMDRANPELCRNELETIKHKSAERRHTIDIAEAHKAVDDLVQFDQREGAAQFATYMHARIDGKPVKNDDMVERLMADTYRAHIASGDYERLPDELKGQMAAFGVETKKMVEKGSTSNTGSSADTDTKDNEKSTGAGGSIPIFDVNLTGGPTGAPESTPEDEVKKENILAVEAYLATLDPTAEGFKDYEAYMLSFAEGKPLDDIKKWVGAQRFIQKRTDTTGMTDFIKSGEESLKQVGEAAIADAVKNKDSTLRKAGISDNIEDVKTYDDFMKAFGKDNGEETYPLVAATKRLRTEIDEDRANTGKMPVGEAVFLANTSEEELKKRDEEINKLLEGDDIKNMLDADMSMDADWKQINDFYDLVKVDRIDSANLVLPNPIDKNVKDEAKTKSEGAEGAEGAEGETPETEESKKKKQSGQELKKDLYELALLKASKELMMAEDYDELNEEERKKRLADLTKLNMSEMTYQLAANQFAYDTAGAGTFRKGGGLPNNKDVAAQGKAVLGHLMGDPSAKGQTIHLSDTVVAATLAANTMPLQNFSDQLQNKVKSSALFQRVKAMDERFTKKYPKAYPIAKQIIAKGATRLAIGYAAGPLGLAVYSGIETAKACKKIRDDYRQQKKEGNVEGKWNYFKKNWPKVVGAAASVVGTAVASWTGIDAVRLNGVDGLGAIGHMFGGEHAASSSVGIVEAAKNLGKNTWGGIKNIVTGNLHEYSAKQVASLSRASMTLASGLGAASQSFAKGDWKAGWAQFGGAFAGAAIAAVMLESQAAHTAEVQTQGSNVGAGGQEAAATLKANPNGLGVDPNQFKLDTPKIDGIPETPEETIAKAQETVNHANNPDFERVKPGLNGGRVDIGAKAPKIELDQDVEKVINDPNAVPQVPEDYQGNGGKGGGQTTVQDDQQQEQQEQQEQRMVIDEEQNDFVEVPEERLAVELDEPKEVRVDDVPEEGSEKYKEMKIEAASNGAALEVTTPDGKSVEFVSAINEETGLRRSVMVTRDAEGNVVSEQEMSDKEARRLARQLAKTDARVNGDVSDTAEKAYKTIKHASSTELHHAKPVVELQQNEDGSQFSLTRGRNGLSGSFTQDNGEPAKYSIIKSKLGGKTTVHYVVTEDNGHQRMMTDAERDKITKQIEETGDKKSIKKLHQFGKKLEYNTNEPQYTASENEIGFRRGNTNIKMTLDENGRAQYTAMQNGKLRPATPEEIKMLKEHAGDKMLKSGTSVQSEAAKASGLSDDAKLMNRVLASEATEKFATEKLGLDEKSLKIGVATDANGNVQASVAVSNNGALYQKGGNTTYAVLNEHKQIEAYTITNGQSQKMDLQSTAKFVGALPKDKIDANSDFGKAINNTVATASRAQSMQRA